MKIKVIWVLILLALITLTVACSKEKETTIETKKQAEAPAQKNEAMAKKQEQSSEANTDASGSNGQEIYQNYCSQCHETGVAGAPKIGDKDAWQNRVAKGKDHLVQSVINGKGNMPPKAGSPGLSEEKIGAAVDYITSQVQGGQESRE